MVPARSRLEGLTPEELAVDPEAEWLIARLTRDGSAEVEPVRVAAFNSYI